MRSKFASCQSFSKKNDRTFLLVAFLRFCLIKFRIFCLFYFCQQIFTTQNVAGTLQSCMTRVKKVFQSWDFCCPISPTERALVSDIIHIFNQHLNEVGRKRTERRWKTTIISLEFWCINENKHQFSRSRLMVQCLNSLAWAIKPRDLLIYFWTTTKWFQFDIF